MSSYLGTADRPDRAKAIAAVVAVHVALAFVIVTGLNVRMVAQAVEQLKTFNLQTPPVPPPPKPQPKPKMKQPEGAPAKKAEPTPATAAGGRLPE